MICGKNLLIQYLDNAMIATDPNKESIKIETIDAAPEFKRDTQVGNDSIDLRIGKKGLKMKCNFDYINTLSLDMKNYFSEFTIADDGYIVYPGETIIVSTVERVKLTGGIIGEITGRTRFARMGLSVCAANKFQSYSNAVIVLHITNHNKVPLKIFPYQKLAQLIIHKADGIPNARRGDHIDEVTLEPPTIGKELAEYDERMRDNINNQKPRELPYMTQNGETDIVGSINKFNTKIKMISKILGAVSAILGLLIGIICAVTEPINVISIIIMAVCSALCTVMAIVLDSIIDKNQNIGELIHDKNIKDSTNRRV